MKAKEWLEKSKTERAQALIDLKEQARKLRFDMATREAKNVSDYKKIKKDIARIETIARQEEVSLDVNEK
ncbi:MAG: 50S ribosomal protein L29 [Candidatus Moranbacteria bacterium]|nr:50S ribosomal protein L29 [Candidatus Moranbacteria bacterium]